MTTINNNLNKFNFILDFVLKSEGGLVNDKDDSGGMTYKGITVRYNPNWKGWDFIKQELNSKSIKTLNSELEGNTYINNLVKDFYNYKYYDKMQLEELPLHIGMVLMDGAILQGTKRQIKNLQKIINNYYFLEYNKRDILVVDGIIGNNTIHTLHNILQTVSSKEVAWSLLIERLDDLVEAVNYRNSNIKYLKGWCNRLLHLYNLLKLK
jgi:lysozyme family protein